MTESYQFFYLFNVITTTTYLRRWLLYLVDTLFQQRMKFTSCFLLFFIFLIKKKCCKTLNMQSIKCLELLTSTCISYWLIVSVAVFNLSNSIYGKTQQCVGESYNRWDIVVESNVNMEKYKRRGKLELISYLIIFLFNDNQQKKTSNISIEKLLEVILNVNAHCCWTNKQMH